MNSQAARSSREIEQRIKWLIKLRWLAVLAVFIVITLTRFLFKVNLSLFPLYIGTLLLFISNVSYRVYGRRLESRINKKAASSGIYGAEPDKTAEEEVRRKDADRFANIQIFLDLLILTYLLHFSGGLENPFMFFFIFHMITAGILLSNKSAYIQAGIAVMFLSGLGLGEKLNILAHHHPGGYIPAEFCLAGAGYIPGMIFVFGATLFLAVYMATDIVNRLRARDKELAEANTKLAGQDRLKSQYLLTVSHDLQASLSAIQSCLKVVLNDLTGQVSDKSREMIGRAELRSRYLLNFVKDLLDLSKIRAEREMEKKPLLLQELIRRITEQLRPKAEEKELSLVIENLQEAGTPGDPGLLEELFLNLISNAIKYTPRGGWIKISLEPSSGGNYTQVSVEDNGIGIPPEEIPHIFEDFYRAKNAQVLEKDGTGLGLSIVKQITEAHGGQIRVESREGKGSKFFLKLPKI